MKPLISRAYRFIAIAALLPLPCFAATSAESTWVSMMMSLVTVLGIIFALAFLYKKLVLAVPGNKTIKVVSILQLGTKEKLVVVELNKQQHLIGVTAQQISLLSTLDEPLAADTKSEASPALNSQLLDFFKQQKK